ncbi:MAG: gliding motility-associated C-terminal domain-containing protein [Bacteroidia bacterium]
MKKNILNFLFLLNATTILISQNLVLNPGFELNSVVPGSFGVNFNTEVNNWRNPTMADPDYYNLSLPNHIVPDPVPHSGNAFSGMVIIAGTITPYAYWREYLQGQLSEPLIANTTYCIEFYLTQRNYDLIGVQNMQVHFSNNPFSQSTMGIINYPAHINIDISTLDTITWRKLTAHYTASGGETYFTIGNYDAGATEIIYYSDPLFTPTAYCYIDDFSVYDCNSTSSSSPPCTNISVPTVFSPNADGHNDIFSIPFWTNCVSEFNIMIFNRWGEKVFQSFDPSFQWTGIHNKSEISLNPNGSMNSEVYVYCITATLNTGEEIIKKGNISVLR